MLKQSTQLMQLPVASLHTGQNIGYVSRIIINPHDLSIPGFYIDLQPEKILLTSDIREVNRAQIIVDSGDVLSETEDLLRLQKILELNYGLIGNGVRTKSQQKLGSVEEYIIDDISWKIQKIHVKQPIWRSLSGGTLIIDHRQIVEVDKSSVIVEDAILRRRELALEQAQ